MERKRLKGLYSLSTGLLNPWFPHLQYLFQCPQRGHRKRGVREIRENLSNIIIKINKKVCLED